MGKETGLIDRVRASLVEQDIVIVQESSESAENGRKGTTREITTFDVVPFPQSLPTIDTFPTSGGELQAIESHGKIEGKYGGHYTVVRVRPALHTDIVDLGGV